MATPNGKNTRETDAKGQSNQTYTGSPTAGHRPDSIQDALRMLDDAISRDGANLHDLVTGEYSNLRAALEDISPRMKETARQYSGQMYEFAQAYAQEGIERGREIADQVDSRVRQNPWPVIGGIALGSLALGFLVGRGRTMEEDTTSTDTM